MVRNESKITVIVIFIPGAVDSMVRVETPISTLMASEASVAQNLPVLIFFLKEKMLIANPKETNSRAVPAIRM